jgi:transposase, IS5 family
MSKRVRFQDTGKGSFFGDYAYSSFLRRHPDHFLVALGHLFDWSTYSERLVGLYQGKGQVGRPPYDPVLIFKMLLVSYLYDVSERATEQLADENVPVKWFLGLAYDQAPPDHSTLTAFKGRLVGNGGWEALQSIFDDLLAQARVQGLELGSIQVLDSVHTQANVNNAKDRERQNKGQEPRDPDARVINKGRRTVVEPDGEATQKQVRYRGYKTHIAMNAETGVVTSIEPRFGNTADNRAFPALRTHERVLALPTRLYAGDRAYDDSEIYAWLAEEGLASGITLNDYRTQKKDDHKEPWLELQASASYQEGTKARYRVEQVFGWAKAWSGFERCRYIGLARYRLQALFTFLVCNAKRLVKLLTGITFRAQEKGWRAEAIRPVYATLPWA